jgi:oxaloacetate decarboxylase (Na+ extruding) subunit alpha
VTRLVDTTLRLLGQEPLAGRLPAGRMLDLCERLDEVGFHALEVSGGGCFQAAVTRGVESPWERIRAYRMRAARTPLAMALRGTFLVGGRPAEADLVRRFILCAAESGIDIFRLHDPLNDADDLAYAADVIRSAGARLYAGLVYADAAGGDEFLLRSARRLRDIGADRVLLHDPAGQLEPAAAGRLVERLREAAGVPVGLYCQGPGGTALAVALEAARSGADPVATASYPVAVAAHRPAGELLGQSLEGLGLDSGIDRERLWEAARVIDEGLGAEPLAPLSPHVSLLAALNRVNAGLIANLERRLVHVDASDRLTDVLDEVHRVRAEVGSPPTASPIGTFIVRQAVDHVLSGKRWERMSDEMRHLVLGDFGQTPEPIDPEVIAIARATAPATSPPAVGIDEARERVDGLAASEEELCLVALFGDDARRLLERIRGRDVPNAELGGAEPGEAERVRTLVRMLEESPAAGEVTIEEGGTRITVKKQEDARPLHVVAAPLPEPEAPPAAEPAAASEPSLVKVTSPMVGVFYEAPKPGDAPYVQVGDHVEVGQTICMLEAMKLFNELKSDQAGTVARVLVENGAGVEFGQALFELVPA